MHQCEFYFQLDVGRAIEVLVLMNLLMTELPPEEVPINSLMSELQFPPLPHESSFSEVTCSAKICNCNGVDTLPVPVFCGGSQEVLPNFKLPMKNRVDLRRPLRHGTDEEVNAGGSELPVPDIPCQQGYFYVPADVVKSLGKPAAHAKIQTEIQKMDPSEFVVHIFQDPPRGCASKMGGK